MVIRPLGSEPVNNAGADHDEVSGETVPACESAAVVDAPVNEMNAAKAMAATVAIRRATRAFMRGFPCSEKCAVRGNFRSSGCLRTSLTVTYRFLSSLAVQLYVRFIRFRLI